MASTIDDNNTTGLLIRRLRLEQKMSQQELAARAGLSFSFVNQVEGGKQTVRLDALNKLLAVFGYAMSPQKQGRTPAIQEPAPIARRKDDWLFY